MAEKAYPTALYALAGAGDLVAEQLRKLASNAPALQAQAQRTLTTLPGDLRQITRELPRDLQSFAADLPSYAAQLQSRARTLDGQTVRRNVETAQERAQDIYTTLIARGRTVVRPGPTPAGGWAEAAPGTTVAKKTAARTTVKKTAPRSASRPSSTDSLTDNSADNSTDS
jgi:hypothetical protein